MKQIDSVTAHRNPVGCGGFTHSSHTEDAKMNTEKLAASFRADISRLRKRDFPGMGQDATIWARQDQGKWHLEITERQGLGGDVTRIHMLDIPNLWDDGATLREYCEKLQASIPAAIEKIVELGE
jgi:hypothetical protein